MKFEFFNSTEFRTIISEIYKLTPHQLEKDLYIYKSKYNFKNNYFHLPFQFYQPKEYFTDSKIKILTKLMNTNKHVSFNSIGRIDSLESNKLAVNPVLYLDRSTDPVRNYKKKFRNEIKKYENYRKLEKIKIIKSNSTKDLQIFYNHLAKSYTKKHKMIFQPFSLYKKLIYEKGFMILAKFEDELLGGGFFIEDGESLHYGWGSYSNTSNYSAASDVVNYAINFSWEKEFKYFNFGSTPLSDNNLLFSKLKYGSEPIDVYQYSNFDKPITDLNTDLRFLRYIFSISPIIINKQISKFAVPLFV